MYRNNRMQYIIKTCSSENAQELQNLLNEMSMNGWELYSMSEVETEDGFKYNCIFMSEQNSTDEIGSGDVEVSQFRQEIADGDQESPGAVGAFARNENRRYCRLERTFKNCKGKYNFKRQAFTGVRRLQMGADMPG